MALLSIVVPMLNESETAPAFCAFFKQLSADIQQRFGLSVELVLVDDGSTDGSVAKFRSALDGNWKIIELSRNFGKEAALFAGIEGSKGDLVMSVDADLQHPQEVCLELIETITSDDDLDIVYTVRDDRKTQSFGSAFGARMFYKLINFSQRYTIPENAGDFRIMRRTAADALVQLRDRRRFNKGLYAWVGFNQKGIKYTPAPRVAGKAKWTSLNLIGLVIEGITSFSPVPLRLVSALGAMVGLMGFLYGIKIIIQVLIYGTDVPGFPSLMSAVSVLGGLNLMIVGLLGEYVWVAVSETKNRPIYLVRRVHRPSEDE